MGKWNNVVKGMSPVPLPEDKQAELNLMKDQLTAGILASKKAEGKPEEITASDLAKKYEELRLVQEDYEAEMKSVERGLLALHQLLVDQYEAEGLQKLTLTSGNSLAVEVEPYAGVKDKLVFRSFCLEDPELAMAMSLPWQTLNSIVKELLMEGKELPPGVEVFLKNKLVLRKAR